MKSFDIYEAVQKVCEGSHGDICDDDLVSKILSENEIEGIINFAAESHVDRSILGPKAFIETNILGTL